MIVIKYVNRLISACCDKKNYKRTTSTSSSTTSSSSLSPELKKKVSAKLGSLNTNGSSNLIATTTIINKKHVIERYSCLTHEQQHTRKTESNLKTPPNVKISCNKNRNNSASHRSKLDPIAESSMVTNHSLEVDASTCNSCKKNSEFIRIRHCKYCGEDLLKKKRSRKRLSTQYRSGSHNSTENNKIQCVVYQDKRKSLFYSESGSFTKSSNNFNRYSAKKQSQSDSPFVTQDKLNKKPPSLTTHHCYIKTSSRREYQDDRSSYTIGLKNLKLFRNYENVQVADSVYKKTRLRKSTAASNIKQISYKSFLSNKKKYSNTVSPTLYDNEVVRENIIHCSDERSVHMSQNESCLLIRKVLSGDNNIEMRKKLMQKNMKANDYENVTNTVSDENKNALILQNKVASTFLVDSSTPIKTVPKTSTPIKV